MSPTRAAMVEAIDRIYHIVPTGAWPAQVRDFLQRLAALEFMAAYMAETAKPLDETVLILLAAIRYIDLGHGIEPGTPCILEEPVVTDKLDLFLVRHHAELFHLCRTRHVQANLFERAFPVMEVLGRRFGDQPLAVIELGCSFGMIGRALCGAHQLLARSGELCAPGQQLPDAVPRVAAYRGVDLWIPDANWLLACISRAPARLRSFRFLKDMPEPADFRVSAASAFDFPSVPEIDALAPRFAMEAADRLVPVVLTSFMLYQFPAEQRERLASVIGDFLRPLDGAWINLDLRPAGESYHFFLAEDGVEKVILQNDICLIWDWH
jgi:hypothetical protein